MVAHKISPLARRLLRIPALVYRCHAGWLLGQRFLPLAQIGRRSGRRYQTVLDVIEYGRRHRWVAPVVRRVLSWLVGWHDDSSEDARRRLVHELPVVAFRPANDDGDRTGT